MQGEQNSLYFQLVDLDQAELRYMPAGSPTLSVIFPAINSVNVLTIPATVANAADPSIWKIDLLATQIPSTGNVQFAITEAGVTKRFVLQQGIMVHSFSNQGGC